MSGNVFSFVMISVYDTWTMSRREVHERDIAEETSRVVGCGLGPEVADEGSSHAACARNKQLSLRTGQRSPDADTCILTGVIMVCVCVCVSTTSVAITCLSAALVVNTVRDTV
jgi:hypothetical protein